MFTTCTDINRFYIVFRPLIFISSIYNNSNFITVFKIENIKIDGYYTSYKIKLYIKKGYGYKLYWLLTNPEVLINLSAIAKGYGIDRVASTLKEQKIQNFLVEIGGDLITSGTNKNGKSWSIGIEAPKIESQIVQSVIKIKDQAMATSGDYKNFFEKNGIRYSHIIDPKTGYPIRHKTLSVTVLAESAALADGWATAMLVLGNNDGIIVANKLNIPVFFISSHEETFITSGSDEFKKIVAGKH